MDGLENITGMVIQQKKEWGEILSGFETKNKYAIFDTDGNQLAYAAESASGFMAFVTRQFLQAWRPFEIQVVDTDNQITLSIKRPFRFYFHEVDVVDANNMHLGTIKRKFAWLRRIYVVRDGSGNELFELFGPILHPWTFNVTREGTEYGKITKKWSGLGKEVFTDADNFGITFPQEWDPGLKAILLGAVFLVDFVHFETKSNN